MKVLQINSTVNTGSTGRIAEEIGIILTRNAHQSYIAAAHTPNSSRSSLIRIGTPWDRKKHALITRIYDTHGFASAKATERLVKHIHPISPDVIHLHNIHGYYLNVKVLFSHLKKMQKPVVWTLHDCWPFTGHCAYFDRVGCYRWQKACYDCPLQKAYPASWVLDRSRRNFQQKQRLFTGLKQCVIVTPSQWLANHVKNSFLKDYPVEVIYNGVDQETFQPGLDASHLFQKYRIPKNPYVLGVASVWSDRKGLSDFMQLRKILPKDISIVLVGLNKKQRSKLNGNMIGIKKTENIRELAALYSQAIAFVNPTYIDNFPSTNIEALSCGTPVITYRTGGSPEAVDENTSAVVEKGDLTGLAKAIQRLSRNDKEKIGLLCRERAEKYFDREYRYMDYLRLYERISNLDKGKIILPGIHVNS